MPVHQNAGVFVTAATSNVVHLPILGRAPVGKKCGSVTTADMIAKVHCVYWDRAPRGKEGPALGEGHFGSCDHPDYEKEAGPRDALPSYRIPAPFPAVRSNFGCALWSRQRKEREP